MRYNAGRTSVSNIVFVQVCEARKGLLHTSLRKCPWKSFIIEAPIKNICDTWSQKLKHQTLVLPVWTFNIEVVRQLHYMP